MADCVDLEIEFARDHGNVFHVFSRLDYPTNLEVPEGIHGTAEFDFGRLKELRSQKDMEGYGNSLSSSLFDPAKNGLLLQLQRAIEKAAQHLMIRIRLVIDDACPELHRLAWEIMRHPLGQGALSISPAFYLSRVLRHGRPRSFTLRQKVNMRALVLIADPAPPEGHDWPSSDRINLDAERARAEAALGSLAPTFLVTGASLRIIGSPQPMSPGARRFTDWCTYFLLVMVAAVVKRITLTG